MPAVGLAVAVLAATGLLLMAAGVFGDVGLVPVATALFVLMSTMGVRPGVADGPAPAAVLPAAGGGRMAAGRGGHAEGPVDIRSRRTSTGP
ncbi:hypothetical protein ACFY2M_09340 [Streptomyces sp. NPDC001276]|uniref:hypothetical protein n=1 Tax=Streptomyces sp. NPDC001276 TaxID=3364555 RepID=UPI00369A1469